MTELCFICYIGWFAEIQQHGRKLEKMKIHCFWCHWMFTKFLQKENILINQIKLPASLVVKDFIISLSRWIVSFAFFVFSYEEARDMLINEEILAPAYYIIGGTKSGQVKTMSWLLPVMLNCLPLGLSLNNTRTLTWMHRRITIATMVLEYLLWQTQPQKTQQGCLLWTGIFLHHEWMQ